MKEIIKLNARILTQVGDHLPEDGLDIFRGEKPDELNVLPEVLRREVCAFCEELNKAIPDDFSYILSVGSHAPTLRLEYRDGANTAYSKPREWKNERSIFEQLKEIDWDADRAEAISASRLFDLVGPMAKKMRPMIPSTKMLQKHCREEMKRFIKIARRDKSKVHVMFFQGDQGGSEEFESLETFKRRLHDMMPCGCHVIAVVANGRPLPVEEIDALKRAALKSLEDMPISHAKATGKYDLIMATLLSEKEGVGL